MDHSPPHTAPSAKRARMSKDHVYSDLDEDRREIRVFRLLPGQWTDIIQIQLQTVPLADAGTLRYETISYSWGDERLETRIEVFHTGSDRRHEKEQLHPVQHFIPESASILLRRFRSLKMFQLLWMDSISINQVNLDERAVQVNMMGDIYRAAFDSHIWLGEPTLDWPKEARSRAVSSARRLGADGRGGAGRGGGSEGSLHDQLFLSSAALMTDDNHPLHTKVDSLDSYGHALEVLEMMANGYHVSEMPIFRPQTKAKLSPRDLGRKRWLQALTCLYSLASRPWWTRVWIVQESVLPFRVPLVHVGPHSISLEAFARASSRWFTRHCERSSRCALSCWESEMIFEQTDFDHLFGRASDLMQLRGMFASSIKACDLAAALQVSGCREATDPRDHVYGVLGLVKSQEVSIDVDYSKPVREVFALASYILMRSDDNLSALLECKGLEGNSGRSPSWAQDWSVAHTRSKSDTRGSYRSMDFQNLRASWDRVRFFAEVCGLSVPAVRCDRIVNVADEKFHRNRPANEKKLGELLRWWLEYLRERVNPLDPFTFWQTIFWGIWRRDPDPVFQPAFTRRLWKDVIKQSLGRLSFFESHSFLSLVGSRHVGNLLDETHNAVQQSTVFVTEDGRIGHGPLDVREGDEVWNVHSCGGLLILRPKRGLVADGGCSGGNDGYLSGMERKGNCFEAVGRCFVSGLEFDDSRDEADWNEVLLL